MFMSKMKFAAGATVKVILQI